MTMRVFIFGAGYSARAFARSMAGEAERIGGTTRTEAKFEGLRVAGIEPFAFDGTGVSPEIAAELARTTHLVVSAGAERGGRPGHRGGERAYPQHHAQPALDRLSLDHRRLRQS